MAGFTCPKCGAEISPDLIEADGCTECPFCEADLSILGLLPQPAVVAESAKLSTEDLSESSGSLLRKLPALPSKSRINVVESTNNRLVFYIPGGGKAATAVGCFALAWCGFMCFVTPLAVGGLFQGAPNGAPPLFMVPFLGLFWAVGI